ncbi:MAG: glycoside hydrolase family 3 N-terminal domain-containing protein, partial [bacterium]|nr:glycoside hydrolase family 3 N-terminal domain-containing protein [bacterium]
MKKIAVLLGGFLIGILLLYAFWVSSNASKPKSPEDFLRDKLGQMLIIGFEGTEFTPQLGELLEEVRPGGVLLLSRNVVSWGQIQNLTYDLQEFALREIGHPLFIAVDQEGGEISRFSWVDYTSQAGLFDKEEGYTIGQKRAKQLREMGVNMNLAP